MANVLVQDTSLTAIANAIREQNGSTDTYKPAEMATAIQGIQAGGGELKTIVASQSYNYSSSMTSFTIQNNNFPESGVDFALVIGADTNNLNYPIGIYDYKASTNKFEKNSITWKSFLAPTAYNPQTHTLSFKYTDRPSFSTSATTYFKITFA